MGKRSWAGCKRRINGQQSVRVLLWRSALNREESGMKTKMKVKMFIDILMTVFVLMLMAYQATGEKLHEWLGTGMAVLLPSIRQIFCPICFLKWSLHFLITKKAQLSSLQNIWR